MSELSIDNYQYQLSILMKFAKYVILQSSVIETLGKHAYEWAHVKQKGCELMPGQCLIQLIFIEMWSRRESNGSDFSVPATQVQRQLTLSN